MILQSSINYRMPLVVYFDVDVNNYGGSSKMLSQVDIFLVTKTFLHFVVAYVVHFLEGRSLTGSWVDFFVQGPPYALR